MVDWFNKVSYFTATEICVQPELKKRARLIEMFIGVADECRNVANFSSLMAVLSGLNNSAVRRLKKTWDLVSQKHVDVLAQLEELMSDDSNFVSYRRLFASMTTSTAVVKTKKNYRMHGRRQSTHVQSSRRIDKNR